MSAPAADAAAPADTGLDDEAVRDRVARGLTNDVPTAPSRTVAHIFRANVLTYFNGLLGSLLVVILVVGPAQDGLFGGVLVANALIGIVQELRAKRTLDRLALLNAPQALVVRNGEEQVVALGGIVLDDVVVARPGDQIVVDGEVLTAAGLSVDESLLTGEADPQDKSPGDEVLSGSFVASGSGRFRATRVGKDAYAVRLAEEARRFTFVHSELQAGVNRILRIITWALVPTAILLFGSQIFRADSNLDDALRGAVAGVVAMVPEGLVLLTSLAFAIAVIRLGRRKALVQEMASVEVLARVDVVCLDKTGTITEGSMVLTGIDDLGHGGEARDALGALGASDPNPNASLAAVAAACPAPHAWEASDTVVFSSARKWSGATFDGHGTWVLGAPDVLLDESDPARSRADALAAEGVRVLVLARSDAAFAGEAPPADLDPTALVTLSERIRPDAADTLAYFARQGVALKVISGDNPRTVAAVARSVGLPGADEPVDARDLPDDGDLDALATALEEHTVFGRVQPHQKRAIVHALQSRGHVVAMTGDGVNDVLALKDADIGIAMGSGSAASRAVAQLVLLDGHFATLPDVVAEGRRVIANVERVANLFLTKSVYAMLLALTVGVVGVPFPFLPRHLTLVSSLTIGIPAFFLSLAPNPRRYRPGFIPRVLRFAVPAGIVAATATFASYAVARLSPSLSLAAARTSATLVLLCVGLWILAMLSRPLTVPKLLLLGAMVACVVAVLMVPALRRFFDLFPPETLILEEIALIAGGAVALLSVGRRIAEAVGRAKRPHTAQADA